MEPYYELTASAVARYRYTKVYIYQGHFRRFSYSRPAHMWLHADLRLYFFRCPSLACTQSVRA